MAGGDTELAKADEAAARFDVDAAVAHYSAAVRAFTEEGDRCRAALACVRLGDILANAMGNLTAGRAWFARAERLVEDLEPCVEQGWVAVAAMGCDVDDPEELLAKAELALDRARRFGDADLETKALADAGLAHVQAGRLPEGMALLDEAMALACGTAADVDTAGKSVCSFFTACYVSADFRRADAWTGLLRQRGLLGTEPGAPAFLSSHCDSVQGALLCEIGRWGDAEALLTRAIADFEAAMGMPAWHPAIALAELRIRQGRLTEAEALLVGKDVHLQALLPMARLHLERGDPELARATARRGLRALGADRLRATELLAVVVDAALATGDLAGAVEAADELRRRAEDLPLPVLRARTAAARARVLAACGDRDAAVAVVEAAVDDLSGRAEAALRVNLLLALARLHEQQGDRAAASVDAKEAAALLADLDMVVPADDAALLERLALRRRAGAPEVAVLARDGTWWSASFAGTVVRLPETKGLRYVAELVANPGVERHALDLVDRVEGVDPGADRRRLGDAGELADSQARTAYRRRIEALRSDIDDALELGAEERAEALQDELDRLVAELASAFGLGGRARRASSAAERARLNVTRAIRTASGKLAEALPVPGAALDASIRTGLYCVYDPGDAQVRWIVQS